jgi:hypothetical protein
MANLSRRWWMFNDWEKDVMRRSLEYRLHKKVPMALLPFYDYDEVHMTVELYRMMHAVFKTTKYYRLECKLGMFPIMRLITYWAMGI